MIVTRRAPETVMATPNDHVRVSVIGDSYSSGFGNHVVWPSLVAAGSQLSISNYASPGAGYVGAGQSEPFDAQVGKALASKPAIIVVFGGMADVAKSEDLIVQAATDLFTQLARRAPAVELVVLGPIWHQDPVPEPFIRLDSNIASAASATHTTYISMINEKWLVDESLIQEDNFTPTDEGQSVLASRLGPILLRYMRNQDRAHLP